MTQSLAKYHSRSPRYILNAHDNSLIRVAGPHQLPWEEETSIKNLSLTGLAFLAPQDLCPSLGEIIKIQFQTPNGHSLATRAMVTRLDPSTKNQTLVGVHFYKTEKGHLLLLAQSISEKLRANPIKEDTIDLNAEAKIEITKKILIMTTALASWLGLVLFLTK
jgi:hypothetical protein